MKQPDLKTVYPFYWRLWKSFVLVKTTVTHQLNFMPYFIQLFDELTPIMITGTKLGRYLAEGISTIQQTMDHRKNNIDIYKKDETIMYSTKYVTTYLGYQICSSFFFSLSFAWYVCKKALHVVYSWGRKQKMRHSC